MSTASFVSRFDPVAADAGKWWTVHGFGQLGYIRLGSGTSGSITVTPEFSYPSGVSITDSTVNPFCWQSPSTKPRATQRRAATTTFDLNTWYAATTAYIRITPTDTAKVYRLRLYCIGLGCDAGGTDNPGENRAQTVTIRDWAAYNTSGLSAPVLATSGSQTNYTDGMYLTFDVSGEIAVVIQNDGSGTASPNAGVSMFTWDDPPAASTLHNLTLLGCGA